MTKPPQRCTHGVREPVPILNPDLTHVRVRARGQNLRFVSLRPNDREALEYHAQVRGELGANVRQHPPPVRRMLRQPILIRAVPLTLIPGERWIQYLIQRSHTQMLSADHAHRLAGAVVDD